MRMQHLLILENPVPSDYSWPILSTRGWDKISPAHNVTVESAPRRRPWQLELVGCH